MYFLMFFMFWVFFWGIRNSRGDEYPFPMQEIAGINTGYCLFDCFSDLDLTHFVLKPTNPSSKFNKPGILIY